MLILPFLHDTFISKIPIYFPKSLFFVLLYAFIQFIGVLWSRDPGTSIKDFIAFCLEGLLLFFLCSNLIRSSQMATQVFGVLTLCAIIMGGVPAYKQLSGSIDTDLGGFAQTDSQFSVDPDFTDQPATQQRASGTIGEQNRYAQFMIILIPITITFYYIVHNTGFRVLAIAGSLFAFIGFSLAFSRGAAVGLLIALIASIALRLLSAGQLRLFAVGGIVVGLLLPQYFVRLSSITQLGDVVSGGSTNLGGVDGAIRGRLTEMAAAVQVFLDHPITGVGPGMFGFYSQEYGQRIGLRSLDSGRQAHSMFLDIAAETGLTGLAAIIGLLLYLFCRLLYARKLALEWIKNKSDAQTLVYQGAKTYLCDSHLATGIIIALLLYLSTGLFLHVSYIRYFWLLLGIGEAIANIVTSKYKQIQPRFNINTYS